MGIESLSRSEREGWVCKKRKRNLPPGRTKGKAYGTCVALHFHVVGTNRGN